MNERQDLLITELLNEKNSFEILSEMVYGFCNLHPDQIPNVIKIITQVVSLLVVKTNDRLSNSLHALQLSVYAIVSKKNFSIPASHLFITALHNCENLFPDGDISMASEAERKYFNAMLEYLKEHKEEYVDSDWAKVYHHNEYLKKILGLD
jgi:hypothetical protein